MAPGKKRQHVELLDENVEKKGEDVKEDLNESKDGELSFISLDLEEDESEAESSVYSGLGSSEDEGSDLLSENEDGGEKGFEEDGSEDESDDGNSDENESENEESDKKSEKDDSANLIKNKQVAKVDEYEFDSSDEEDIRNTVGNIPMEWYDEYPHIGYDWDGNKIMKPATKDELDKFLDKMEDSNYWRTVKDKMTGQDVVLSDEHVDLIQRIQGGKYPDKNYNPYKKWVDTYSHEVEKYPLTNQPEHKRSFIPSKVEKEKVAKLVHAIKMGWILTGKQRKHLKDKKKSDSFYMLWDERDSNEISKRMAMHMPAPKLKLPGHRESYNPPPEFIPDDKERYSALRQVPSYNRFIQERFNRCLDLYMCPRQRKTRLNIEPDDLLPQIPKAKDLQPFPTTLSIVYRGHTGAVSCITIDQSGQYLASGSDDKSIKFWEVSTGRCLQTISVSDAVKSIEWCPNVNVCIVAATVGNSVLILNPGLSDKLVVSNTDTALLASAEKEDSSKLWQNADDVEWRKGIRVSINHPKELKQVTWHARGDYFASVMATNECNSVQVHQLTKRQSQKPFSKSKGIVQCVLFHPTKPLLFVATQKFIRIYNLVKQSLEKKLTSTSDWISSMAIHHGGDNVITGSYDPKLNWFDLDLSTKPYKVLRHHKGAIRKVAFHKRYPLFASASDDCSVIVCHGKVFNDLLQNPLIVPIKVLRGHRVCDDLGALDCLFHPNSPWVFSSGSDGRICLFT